MQRIPDEDSSALLHSRRCVHFLLVTARWWMVVPCKEGETEAWQGHAAAETWGSIPVPARLPTLWTPVLAPSVELQQQYLPSETGFWGCAPGSDRECNS